MADQDASIVCRDRPSVRLAGPVFPKARCSLWDKTIIGQPVFLHISHYRKPRLCVPEKIVKLVQHQCEIYGQDRHMLIGTLVVDDDGEGVQIQVDRLDTRSKCSASSMNLTAGNVSISFQVTNNAANERAASVDDYILAFEHLQSRCCSKDSIDVGSFLHLCGWGSFYSTAHTSVMHLDWDMVTMETTFKSTPVTPVPIVLTALSKNLACPKSLSSIQGAPKTGYLTMDHTRKLLLVLESDPKATVLPIIGIWVSGVELVHHPFVWTACLRYTHNTHLQDRVCIPPEQFLLVLYTPLHSRPEFYQCETNSGDTCLQFELSSGHDVINMNKGLTSPDSGSFIAVDIEPAQSGNKKEIFEAAKLQFGVRAVMGTSYLPGQEDLEPRCAPTPHSEKVPLFHPLVPDVSVLWADCHGNHITSAGSHERKSVQSIPQDSQEQLAHMDLSSRCVLLAQKKGSHSILVDSAEELHAQHSHILSARPLLPHHYSPSGQNGQHIHVSVSDFPHNCQSAAQNIHNFSVSGQASVPSAHVRASTPQSPSVTLPPPEGTSSKVSLTHSTTKSCSQGYYRHPGTCTVTNTISQSLPLSGTGGSICELLDRNQNKPQVGYPQNSRTRLIQNSDNCQLSATSAYWFGQDKSTLSAVSVDHGTPTAIRHTQTNIMPAVSQYLQSFSTRDFLQHRSTLKTITEEASSTPFSSSQKLDHHLEKESQSADILELKYVDPECEVSNRSPSSSTTSNMTPREDSGLSVTPHKLSTSLAEHEDVSLASTVSRLSTAVTSVGPTHISLPASLPSQSSIEIMQWEQIPAQVRALLIQQHEQLQQLQQQVHMLQSQQLQKQISEAGDVVIRGQNKQPIKYSSVAVNTTFYGDQNNGGDGHMQTDCEPSQDRPGVSNTLPGCKVVPAVEGSSVSSIDQAASHFPQASSHSSSEDISQTEAIENVSQTEASEDVSVFDQTTNIDLSELAIQMPEYVSSISERSQMDQSSSSVSDYYRQSQEDLYSSLGEDAADPKQYYSQIMKNIQTFLTNTGSQDSKSSSPTIPGPDTEHRMALSKLESATSSTIVPETGCVSMLLGWGSDSWQSMEINALAMKYLSDEQLTQMAKLRQSAPNRLHNSECSAKFLQQVIGTSQSSFPDTTSTQDVSCFGISPSDMTLGTRMYLEKHGLLGNDGSILENPVMGHELQLRTDFSILTNGSSGVKTNLSLTTNGGDPYNVTNTCWSERPYLQPVPHQPRMSPALPSMAGQTAALTNNENCLPQKIVLKDFAGSPILPVPKMYAKNRILAGEEQFTTSNIHQRNVLQEMKPQAVINLRARAINCPEVDKDEENLLDIDMLKQMPKLL